MTNAQCRLYSLLLRRKKGFSKFGSYVGNGNADGALFIQDFKPAFVMIKQSSGSRNWSNV